MTGMAKDELRTANEQRAADFSPRGLRSAARSAIRNSEFNNAATESDAAPCLRATERSCPPLRVAFVSLGCAKNLVDSEKMLGQLAEAGCAVTADEDDCDAIVINTCGFLAAARDEADEVICEAVARKADGRVKRVVVAGCLVQRDIEALLERIDGVDALVGVNNRDDIVRAVLGGSLRDTSRISTGLNGSRRPVDLYLSDYHPFVQTDTARLRLTPRHFAYLRISEGCDQKCTFCTIPSIRGRMHCKPPEVVLSEARELVADGAVEISLIGQDTTSYGLGEDRFDVTLAGLLRMLDKVDGLEWLRLMYAYPTVMTDEMIDAIAECEHVCKYVDLPLQHINDRVLKAMHRRIDRAGTERLLQRIRDRIPGVTIRTTMIAGFPGETEAEFEELVEFVRDFRFDALGVFPYSLEPETPAGRMKGQLPAAVIRERVDRLMKTQQDVAFALARERVGTTLEVLVDGIDESGRTVSRHEGQAPMVDSITFLVSYPQPGEQWLRQVQAPALQSEDHRADGRCAAGFRAGQFLTVRCVDSIGYDLAAAPVSVALPVLRA